MDDLLGINTCEHQQAPKLLLQSVQQALAGESWVLRATTQEGMPQSHVIWCELGWSATESFGLQGLRLCLSPVEYHMVIQRSLGHVPG